MCFPDGPRRCCVNYFTRTFRLPTILLTRLTSQDDLLLLLTLPCSGRGFSGTRSAVRKPARPHLGDLGFAAADVHQQLQRPAETHQTPADTGGVTTAICRRKRSAEKSRKCINVTLVRALFPVLELLNFGLDEDHSPVKPLCSSTKVSR